MRQATGADVIPAKAGIQMCRRGWMPATYRSTGQAYAGITDSPRPLTHYGKTWQKWGRAYFISW
jgi:hypothetical protein